MRRSLLVLVSLVLAGLSHAQDADQGGEGDSQPTVVNSTTGPPPLPLPPPPPIPPPDVDGAPDTPGGRAGQHMDNAELLDALGVRVARRVAGAECDVVVAGVWTMTLVLDEARLQLQTADAVLGGAPAEAARTRLDGLDARLEHLGGLVRLTRRAAGRCEEVTPEAPGVWLPESDAAPVDGRVVMFARADAASRVIWVDEVPLAVTGPTGWSVLVLAPGERRLCAAPGDEPACRSAYVVEASMGAAFDLRDAEH